MTFNSYADEHVKVYVNMTVDRIIPVRHPLKTTRIKTLFSTKHSHPPGPHLHTPRSHEVKQNIPRSPISNSTPYIPGFKQLHFLFIFCSAFTCKVFRRRLRSSYIHEGGLLQFIDWMLKGSDLL